MAVSAKTLGFTPEPCEEGMFFFYCQPIALYSGHGRAGRVCSDGDLNVRRVKASTRLCSYPHGQAMLFGLRRRSGVVGSDQSMGPLGSEKLMA